jgi:hypothetical protein
VASHSRATFPPTVDILMSVIDILMMRTTVRLDSELLRQAKRRALETGRSLNAVIEDALRAALQHRRSAQSPRVELPVSGAGGTLPGVDLDNTASLYDILDGR